jgi:uncharacterized protein (DUF983 family)
MSGPFDDLDPDEPRERAPDDPIVSDRGVPALDEAATIEGDRLRRPRATAPHPSAGSPPAPVVRRPRRERARPVRHDPRNRSEVGALRASLRGLTRRCPRCGGGRLFSSWFSIRERCPRCGFRLEREEGGFLGAMTINYTATAVVWLGLFVVWLVVDLPSVHVLELTIASVAVAVVVPLLFWPISKTLWAVVDYLVTESEGAHVPEDGYVWDELEARWRLR